TPTPRAMRLFLLISLVTALVTALPGRNVLREVAEYRTPGGFPDGTILTFYFRHHGRKISTVPVYQSVVINFYDLPRVDIDQVYDVTAHLRIDRKEEKPVTSDTYVNGQWVKSDTREQPLDQYPMTNGWWRVERSTTFGRWLRYNSVHDTVKCQHDNEHMNVFLNGYWSGVREFQKSLDNVASIYLNSPFVDISTVRTCCTETPPNGDLQHLYLQRISQTVLRMRLFYKPSAGAEGNIDCEHTLPEELASQLDEPFDIMSEDGALLFHLEDSIPRTIGIRDN
ncbi:hypothetical protein PENTCL1PPCAC_9430, partial [Pristionchus entomophagus]